MLRAQRNRLPILMLTARTETSGRGAGHGDQAITTSQTPAALEMLKSVFGE